MLSYRCTLSHLATAMLLHGLHVCFKCFFFHVFVAGKIAKSMGNLAVETTSVAQCMMLYRALGDQIGVWVQFRGRRLCLVQLEEMGHEEEI